MKALYVAAFLLASTPASACLAPNPYDGSMFAGQSCTKHVSKHVNRAARSRVYSAKPRKWCGWYMRTLYGGGPAYNRAWAWSKRGYPAHPHVGAVVVWRHHVGYISGQSAKGWLVTSGNDGNAVRTRVRSLKGAVIRGGV